MQTSTETVADVASTVAKQLIPSLRTEIRQETQVLGREDLAEALGVSLVTVDRMIRRNEIPSTKIGRRRLFNLAAVLEQLNLAAPKK